MNRVFAGIALVGLTASLGACVYYPHGPYGPGYGPPPPAYGGPPPPGYEGPPPGAGYDGPPPGQQPPPGYGQEGPPPQGADGPPEGAQQGPKPGEIKKMNDPTWCAQHPHRCAKLRNEYGGGQPPQGAPPPGAPPQQ